jgi:hypothetical protein
MKELILYYSYSGKSKNHAEKYAAVNGFDICEIVDKKRPSKVAAYASCLSAVKYKGSEIQPLSLQGYAIKFEDYSTINLFSPVWASAFPPPVVTALEKFSAGKEKKIKVTLLSSSGKSNKEKNSEFLKNLNFEVVEYNDIK